MIPGLSVTGEAIATNNDEAQVVLLNRAGTFNYTLRQKKWVSTLGTCSASAHLSTNTSGCEVVQTSLHIEVPTHQDMSK